MKKLSLLVLFVLSSLLLFGCSSSNETNSTETKATETKTDSETIKIAAIFSTSGGAAPLGEPEMEAAKMLVDMKNNEGGINGKKIELVAYDDKSDQNEAVLAMKKAITQDKVSAIIGGTISGNALAMLPLAEQNKVPLMAVAASSQIYKKEDGSQRDYVFKVSADDTHAVERILQYLKAEGLTKIAWLNVANNYGTGGHIQFQNLAPEYGVEAVIEDEFDVTVKDAKPMLTRVKKANPQAIIVWGTVQESAVVIKNIRELGIELPIIGSHGISSEQLFELAGDAANGLILPTAKVIVADQLADSDPQKEVILQFKEQFEKQYNKPVSLFAGHVWDSFTMLTKAIEKVGTDGTAIRDYLANDLGEFVGQDGVFHINPENHNGLSADDMVILKVEDKKWVLSENK